MRGISKRHMKPFLLCCCIALTSALVLLNSKVIAISELQQGDTADVPILMYHSISDNAVGIADLSVTAKSFEKQMRYLSDNGYTPIYFDQLDQLSQYKKPILITFDDGYTDNYTNAYPILKKYNFKSTIFMITNAIDRSGYLSRDEIQEMGDLISFQSHTVDHLKMNLLNLKQVEYECAESKSALSEITGKPVYVIAYPNGCFNDSVISIASKYYSYGVTTLTGFNSSYTEKYELRRFGISRSYDLDKFISLLNNT
jgi:peptidoglycan/xylan/chitin deacetylase (PgdA/CDA1 family)